MSEQQKIWFIYLTDHHEGPFTVGEIAEKAKAGLVNAQSLAWKDGMPEWVPAETIPELSAAVADQSGISKTGNLITKPEGEGSGSAVSTTDTSDGEVSLAQLLAQQQSIGENTSPSGQISDSASVLKSMLGQVQKDNPVTMGSGVSIGGITQQTKSLVQGPPPDEDAWTLKIGAQVSGMHSLNRLKELASGGEIPPDAMVWHAGWSDFQPVSSVTQLDVSRKKAGTKSTNTKTSMTKPGMMVSGQSNNAVSGDDEEPTDTEIELPPRGIKGVLFKLKSVFKRKKKSKAAPAAAAPAGKGKIALTPVGAPKKTVAPAKGATAMKRIVILFMVLLVLAGGGFGAWFFLLASPLPSNLDVKEEDLADFNVVVKMKREEGAKLAIAQARGPEDAPLDTTSPDYPKYYVATNLPEGTSVTLTLTGVPGTLVNRTTFENSYTATVDKTHLAVFSAVKDASGKPLWGQFNLKAAAEGAEPVEARGMFIGNKGGPYQSRLSKFKESVQAEYDKEIEELRQFITTLKAEQADASRLIKAYKEDWPVQALRTRVSTDWTGFVNKAQNFLGQIEQKLKDRLGGAAPPKYHARAYQDVSTTLGQLQQLVKAQSERLAGTEPSANIDELDGLVQAGVLALEAWLAQAVAKSPFDVSPQAPPLTTTPPAAPTPPAGMPEPTPAPATTAPAPAPASP